MADGKILIAVQVEIGRAKPARPGQPFAGIRIAR